MRRTSTVALSGLVIFVVMSTNPTTAAASQASSAGSLLSARNMTEEQYLESIVPVFRQLYGPMAEPAALLIWRNAGPVFAMDAMTRCYGEIWALEGPLGVKERSLATISALVAQRLYPEIKLHINGFLSSGGTLEELCAFIALAAQEAGGERMDELRDAIVAGLQWRGQSIEGYTAPNEDQVTKLMAARDAVGPQEALLATLSAAIGLGDMDKVRTHMTALARELPTDVNRDAYMDQLVVHLVLYCGYPRGLNALHVWQQQRQ